MGVTITTADPVFRLVPVRVTTTALPRAPVVGVIEVSVGEGASTVNVTALVVPPGVVTVTLLAFGVAPFEIMKVAVI